VRDFRSILGVLMMLACGLAVQGQSPSRGLPQLTLDPPGLELGALLDLDAIDQSVRVRNTSSQPARIVDVRDSCGGCVEYELTQWTLDPGEETVLRLRVNPLGLRGLVRILVVVATADLDQPQKGMELTAEVIPAFEAQGVPVEFPEMSSAQQLVWRVKLKPRVGLEAPFTRVISDLEHLSGEVVYDDDRGVYRVDITAGPGLAVGHYDAVLQVTSDDPKGLAYPLPVHLRVVPKLEVAPNELVLDRTDREQLRILFVSQRTATPARIASVEVSDSRIRYRIPSNSSLAAQRVNLYCRGLSGAAGYIGDVTVRFSDEGLNAVSVPVYVQDLQGVVIEPSCGQHNRPGTGSRAGR
jgi:hypothetical protein